MFYFVLPLISPPIWHHMVASLGLGQLGANMTDKALQPIEQKQVDFYGDELTAVRLADGSIYVSILGISHFHAQIYGKRFSLW